MSTDTASVSNFLRTIIDNDLKTGRYKNRKWATPPSTAKERNQAPIDPAVIRTRFPPEPNGYLHIGHAKSICLNFGLAKDYQGICHLRFDDTNPEKEEAEYVEAIKDIVQWLGFDWHYEGQSYCFYASDYFTVMYKFAQALIKAGYAYVDEQSADEIRENRGTLTKPGQDSPWRNRPSDESLVLLQKMKDGEFPNGSMSLRAKIDMASPNINLRDPVLYRIRHAAHHRTGDAWCIYPMYSWAHPVEDALEGITHSICTLEFEDQRPFYDWILKKLVEIGELAPPLPHQHEFARLNLEFVVTSKRKLRQLIEDRHVEDWDDPRLPTLAGLRRRGYTPAAIRLFCERIGVSKADSRIEYNTLEQALRDDLDPIVDRAVAIIDPIKLVITNFPDNATEPCSAPINPHNSDGPRRNFSFTKELWIERDDFKENPPKKYFRLFPGNLVRLKYGFIIKCTGCTKDAKGNIIEVQAEYLPDTKSGTPGANSVKVKGTITWLSATDAIPAEIRLYDRLFTVANPDGGDKNFLDYINPNSIQIRRGWLEPGIKATPGTTWQFERLGYFTADSKLSTIDQPVINRTVTLRDTWV